MNKIPGTNVYFAHIDEPTIDLPATGWEPEPPDRRDRSVHEGEVKNKLDMMASATPDEELLSSEAYEALPSEYSIIDSRTKIRDQGRRGSCVAMAVCAAIERQMLRRYDRVIQLSPLFLYYTVRRDMNRLGQEGAYIRKAMRSVRKYGVPTETEYPYIQSDADKIPDQHIYASADDFSDFEYDRIDTTGISMPMCLDKIRMMIKLKVPVAFGFWGFTNYQQGEGATPGCIPFPGENESYKWAHAVCAVGYNDNFKIRNKISKEETTGAICIQNSWGTTGWKGGDNGYFWLPYKYVLSRYVRDMWIPINFSWVL